MASGDNGATAHWETLMARDGHEFVEAALKAGAGLAVVAADKRESFAKDAPLLVVPDVLEGLTALARLLQWPLLAEPGAGPRPADVGARAGGAIEPAHPRRADQRSRPRNPRSASGNPRPGTPATRGSVAGWPRISATPRTSPA